MDFSEYEKIWGSENRIKLNEQKKELSTYEELKSEREKQDEELARRLKFYDPKYCKKFNQLLDYVNEVIRILNNKYMKKLSKINHCHDNSNFINRNEHLYNILKENYEEWIKIDKPKFDLKRILFNPSHKPYIIQYNLLIDIIKKLEDE